jgi:quinoprotein glucose dehydrogenase
MTKPGRLRLVPLWTMIILLAPAARVDAQRGVDWPVTGGDAGGMKYSALSDINRSNVARLQVAWTWETGEKAVSGPRLPVPGQAVRPGSFETTPVVIGDTMYVSTPYNRVVALDASTGRVIWVYDPRTVEWGQVPNGTGFVHRGVAIWSGPDGRRVFLNSRWRLIALDASTGRPVDSFGHRGEIDLTDDLLWPTNRLHYTQTSPPVVFGDLVIVGNGVWDGFIYRQDPPGNIQAYDVHTGRLVWRFNLIPQEGEFGNDTWKDASWRYTGHSNAWAPMTVDERRGLLFVPVGTPSNDYYGGQRRGDNLFAESLLVLDARTGRRVWHFQTVHHGLWDYDLPGPPTLLSINVDGRRIDAVAVASKTGFVYVFDRVTGQPVWPIVERAVPQSDIPGEETSPTQPFPTRPAPIARIGLTEDDLIDFTPELRALALEQIRKYRYGAPFLPPSAQGSIAMPGIIGGANWGGAAADPETGIVYVKASNSPSLLTVTPADTSRAEADYTQDGTAPRNLSVDGLPIVKPPYGTLTAIDLNRGEHLWQVPIGDAGNVRNHPRLRGVPLPARLGASGAPGPIVTRGGLVFITGGSTSLYAIDAATGTELWEGRLGARSNANPMTYRTRDGRQMVVVATGSGDDCRLVAFAVDGPRATSGDR